MPYQPSALFDGRNRSESFSQQSSSGLTSGGASTIVGHETNRHFNSSRIALNNDWRISSESRGEIGTTLYQVSTGNERYGRADQYLFEYEKGLSPQQDYSIIPPSSPVVREEKKPKFDATYPVIDDATTPSAIIIKPTNRLEWIDGLRGIASIIIFTHHFSDLTWSQMYPAILQVGSLEGFMR